MDERQLTFQEHALARTVIDDDVGVSFGYNLVIFCLVIPHPEFNHLDGVFGNLGFVGWVTSQVQIDVTVHGRVGLGQDDALNAVGNLGTLMLRGHDPLDDGISVWVGVEPVEQLGLGDVVRVDKGFLPVSVGTVFTQYANTCGFHHVGVDAVVDNEFDKG